ncbi:MAG: dihydrodipicolinate synthase family protein [Paracoccaceae bacterium]
MPSLRDSQRLARPGRANRLPRALRPAAAQLPFRDDEIVGYYRALAATTALPLNVYEVPVRTGRPLPLDTLLALLDLPGVAGIKFTSTDLFKLSQLIRRRPEKTYFFGFDEIYATGALLGADGGIGTTYNLLGKLYMALDAAMRSGEMARAKDLQDLSQRFVEALMDTGVLPGMKAAFRAIGLDVGPTRLPMAPRVADGEARMASLLDSDEFRAWLA